MKVKFDHLALRCTDIEKVKSFFTEVLGLTVGYRPPFPFPGFWLYADKECILHIFGSRINFSEDELENHHFVSSERNNVDHIAFWSDAHKNILAKIEEKGINFSETTLPGANIRQVFIQAPENLIVEVDFNIE
jgi:catechol 2,3-dioxygenase-like lactoylglutathione lyase family enzyme